MRQLDLPGNLAKEAETEYNRICHWLVEAGSPLTGQSVELYPQGSFRLGTPIRPVHHEDEFDIDLVCKVDLTKEQTTQKALKDLVGARLKTDTTGTGRLEERRRCWTLFYPKKFHLDVLPTIADQEHKGDGILVTDTELHRWQFSNPKGYADWFYSRMETQLNEERTALAKALRVDIEQVPKWRVRTPLQRAVQVLKRHRDIAFRGELAKRPVSIILTTLAGRSYAGERDLTTALIGIVERLEDHVDERDGKWLIVNPAHDGENFADKWNERPALRDVFLRWRDRVHEDIEALANVVTDRDRSLLVEKTFQNARDTQSPSAGTLAHPVPSIPRLAAHPHRKPVPWPVGEIGECSVSMRWRVPSGAGKWRSGKVNRVPKHASLTFTATVSVAEPYETWWQITNTGEEARQAGALRGNFETGYGRNSSSRDESTLYCGTHMVQAFVVKGGVVVAKSEELLVRIERQ